MKVASTNEEKEPQSLFVLIVFFDFDFSLVLDLI